MIYPTLGGGGGVVGGVVIYFLHFQLLYCTFLPFNVISPIFLTNLRL